MRAPLLTGLTLGLVALAACARQQGTPPTATSTNGTVTTTAAAPVAVVPNDQAIEKITTARCAREHACKNIGPDREFESFEACKRQLVDSVGPALRVEECPNGISELDLSSCVSDIHEEREHCDDAFEKVNRLFSCRKSKLCR